MDVQGNLSVSRNAHVGGHARVLGDLEVGHNVRVSGWLDAPNIRGPFKGLFESEEELLEAYPRPRPGWYALVGTTLPASLWAGGPDGWHDTGGFGGTDTGSGGTTGGGTSLDRALLEQMEANILLEAAKRFLSRLPASTGEGTDLTSTEEERTAEGHANFPEGLTARDLRVTGLARFEELLMNRQRVMDCEMELSEGGTIESLTGAGTSAEGNAVYRIKLYLEPEERLTLIEGDILCGIWNGLTSTGDGGADDSETPVWEESWLKVLAVDTEHGEITALLYAGEDCPSGINNPPRPMMTLARRGNAGGRVEQLERQRRLTLSARDGRIMTETGVTRPKRGLENIGTSMGTLPDEVAALDSRLAKGAQGFYGKWFVGQGFIRVDYAGKPVAEITWRGEYDANADYHDGSVLVEATNCYEWSLVGHMGCQFLCNREGTRNPPAWDSADWTVYQGDPRLQLAWLATQDSVTEKNPELTLEAIASVLNQDVTDHARMRWDWERESWHDGVQDTASDSQWNTAHLNHGPRVDLTLPDFNYSFGMPPEKIYFTVRGTLIDTGEPGDVPAAARTAALRLEL